MYVVFLRLNVFWLDAFYLGESVAAPFLAGPKRKVIPPVRSSSSRCWMTNDVVVEGLGLLQAFRRTPPLMIALRTLMALVVNWSGFC